MKTSIRLISLILAMMMLLTSFVACGPDTSDDGDSNSDDTAAETKNSALADIGINWDGADFRILGRGEGENNMFRNFELDRDSMPEDVVGIAVWNRNEALMSKYGINVVGTLVDDKPNDVAKLFLEAGDDQYDLIVCPPNSLHPLAMQGYLVDIPTLKYIDTDMDCWNSYANKQLTMGGKLYYTTNKFLLHDKHRTWMVFYNRELARQLNIGYLETEVFDGTWTIDRLIEISRIGSAETDGIDGMSYDDRWGVAFSSNYCFAQLAFASGFRLSRHGADGYPELIGATDEMVSIVDKIYELIENKNACYMWQLRPESEKPAGRLDNYIFCDGHAVVIVDVISTFDDMKAAGVSFEFGAIPNPKYNEAQEDYYSFPNYSNGSLFGVPFTIFDPDKVGFALEAISEESVDTTYKEYIETKCKLQDVYDEDSARCLDIIFKNVVYDIVHVSNIGNLGEIVNKELPQADSNIYARRFYQYERRANKELKQIREAYESVDR